MNVKLVHKSLSNHTHGSVVHELKFLNCSETVYSEFIEIICNTTLC